MLKVDTIKNTWETYIMETIENPLEVAHIPVKTFVDTQGLGLCVGHDSLFIKYSEAPVTIFAVKDRVLGHNPLAVIYQAEAYYKNKLFPQKDK